MKWAAFEDQDQNEWKKAVEDGGLGQGVRGQRLRDWQLEWEEFCLWIVTEFGEESELGGGLEEASIEEKE